MFKRLEGIVEGVTEAVLEIDEMMSSPYVYDQGLVKVIKNGSSYDVFNPVDYLQLCQDRPIKVEGMEKRNALMWETCKKVASHFDHSGPVSCHLFLSAQHSLSFPMHEDLEDVVIYMVSGSKVFESPDGSVTLRAGDTLLIPKGTKHQAHNTDSSIMLSFGLEQFTDVKL